MNILTLENITKTLGERTLFDQATLGINEGDKIGVVGVNGTGKSTLLKIAAGLEEADSGRVVKGNDITLSYLEQAPSFDNGMSIIDYVVSGALSIATSYNSGGREHTPEERASIEGDAKAILTRLGISDFGADVTTLSGGQKKRIALARALVHPADILILDEPTNHLDHNMVIWLENYIKGFRGQLLMVTHDRYFLDNVTNRIVEIDRGHLYSYATNYSGFLEAKTQREDMALATEDKRQNMLRKELAWISRGCKARSTKQQARIDRYEDMKEASRQARLAFDKKQLEMGSIATRLGKKTIELDSITKGFGEATLIRDFTYIFLRDDRVAFIGDNGCGKSTLMKIIAGLTQPDSGTVEIGPTVRLGFFMQENSFRDESETVLEYVKDIGEYVLTADGRISASQMCEKFLFSPKMQWTPISKLSGGEKRRLYLLSVLMEAPNVLILDEPTNDLDIETLEILEDYLDNFAGIIIMVSHDRYFLDRMADRIFAFQKDGRLRQYEGGYSDYKEKCDNDAQSNNHGTPGNDKPDDCAAPKKPYGRTHQQRLKFTYSEQREFDTIDGDIEKLEAKLTSLDAEIAKSATQYTKLNELMNEKSQVQEELDHKMERWVYLNELKEKIDGQQAT
jgi:ATP-binding cassette subfamily F protein uup